MTEPNPGRPHKHPPRYFSAVRNGCLWCQAEYADELEARITELEEAYATWNPSLATDEPDGLPDRRIVPLVEHLRSRGIVTLQSCAGHRNGDNASDGCLWVAASSIDEHRLRELRDLEPFSSVKRTLHPEERWEFEWYVEQFDAATQALAALLQKGSTR